MRQEWIGKRKATRQGCRIAAEVRCLDDRPSVEATIVNISKSGARLEVAGGTELPDLVDIYIPEREELKYARIVRRDGADVAVEFMSSRANDPRLIEDIVKRLKQVEDGPSAPDRSRPRRTDSRTARLEARIATLEAELAALRTPDRLPEIQALHGSLVSLADRLERAAGVPPAVTPERVDALASELEDLRLVTADLCAAMASLQTGSRGARESDGPATESLAQDVKDLHQALQTMILLVSQLIRRGPAAA